MAQIESTLFEYRLSQLEKAVSELVETERTRIKHREDFLVERIAGPGIVGLLLLLAQHFWR